MATATASNGTQTDVANPPRRLSVREQQEKDILGLLAELGGQRVQDDDLLFQGRKLIIPETMTAQDAINYLENHIEQMEETHLFERKYRYRPWDGAHALQNALVKVLGTRGIGQATWSFFSRIPPQLRTINVGPNETVQVPWGRVEVPLFKGVLTLGAMRDEEYGLLFHLYVEAPRRFRAQIEGLFIAVEQELRTNSIYKGQAIDGKDEAEFLDLSGVDPSKVIYSDDVIAQLNANVWSLLEHSQTMRELGMPLKRAVLLEGPYGTGKTLAAFLTAQKAVQNGWTFIYCRPSKDDLGEVMATARLYQPSVVFFEDVDVIAESGDGDNVTRLLDIFDGITAKGTELMAVLTTNHKERIHRGMVRPGRLDAMIHIGALDMHGCARMIQATVPDHLLDENLDYEAIFQAMEGFLPAFVKEAIDRALRYGIARNGGIPSRLVTEDFVLAAEGLRPQLELMQGASEGKRPDTLGKAVEKVVREVVGGTDVVDSDGDVVWSLHSEETTGRVK